MIGVELLAELVAVTLLVSAAGSGLAWLIAESELWDGTRARLKAWSEGRFLMWALLDEAHKDRVSSGLVEVGLGEDKQLLIRSVLREEWPGVLWSVSVTDTAEERAASEAAKAAWAEVDGSIVWHRSDDARGRRRLLVLSWLTYWPTCFGCAGWHTAGWLVLWVWPVVWLFTGSPLTALAWWWAPLVYCAAGWLHVRLAGGVGSGKLTE